MKNIISAIVLVTIINTTLFAQNVNDSTKIKKNEIAINTLPLINMISNTDGSVPISHVFYKRFLTKNWYARVNIALMRDPSLFRTASNYEINSIRAIANSKVEIKYSEHNSNEYLQYGMGIEKRWGKGKIKQFAGIDISYSNYRVNLKKNYAISDSVTKFGYFIKENFTQKDSIISHQRNNVNSFYLTPFYGAQLSISKRLFISGQLGIDIAGIFTNTETIVDNNIKKLYSGKTTQFSFDLTGISSNISVGFRF